MSLEDFKNRWLELCENFVGDNKFSERRPMPIFKAQGMVLPDEVKTAARREDIFAQLKLEDPTVNGFSDFTITDERLEEASNFLKYGEIKLALEYQPERGQYFHVVNSLDKYKKNDIWFIGDVHGDILGLRTAIAFINSNSKHKPIYIFMGDLFDRNLMSLNVVLDVVKLIREQPGQVLWISGNHDDGLYFDQEEGTFKSRVIPNEFSEFLNLVDDEKINSFAKELISFIHKLPIGLLFENGLLVTHGGIPSRRDRNIKNIWESVKEDDISNFICEQRKDVLCNRFDADAMSGTKTGEEFSWIELMNLSAALKKRYGISTKTYLRGHDHCELCRHKWATIKNNRKCKEYENCDNVITDVLTMTSMVLVDDGEKRMPIFSKYEFSYPTIARLNNSTSIPQCYSISIREDDIKSYEEGVSKAFYSKNIELLNNRKDRCKNKIINLNEEKNVWENKAKCFLEEKIRPENQKKDENKINILNKGNEIEKIRGDIGKNNENIQKMNSDIEDNIKIIEMNINNKNKKKEDIKNSRNNLIIKLNKIINCINQCNNEKSDTAKNNQSNKNRQRENIDKIRREIYNIYKDLYYKFNDKDFESRPEIIIQEIDVIKKRINDEEIKAENEIEEKYRKENSRIQEIINNNNAQIFKEKEIIEQLEFEKNKKEKELQQLKSEKERIDDRLITLRGQYETIYNEVESLKDRIGKISQSIELINRKLEEFNNYLQ